MPKNLSDKERIEKLEEEMLTWKSLAIERGEEVDNLREENAELLSQIPKPDYEDTEKHECWHERPDAYAERVTNRSPFEKDQDIKDWAQQQLDTHGEDADLQLGMW